MNIPKLRVTVPRGERVFTKVELDGRLIPATRVAFDSGDMNAKDTGLVIVRLEFMADIEFEADVPLTLTSASQPGGEA